MAALKELLPPTKSAAASFYDHSKDPWFKERFNSSSDPDHVSVTKPNPVPPYGKRSGFVPRKPEDFGDGGAFPEIHVAQYPLGMGRKGEKPGSKILPLTVDSQGKVAFDAIVKQNENASKIVYSQHKDLVPKLLVQEEKQSEEMEKEIEETTQRTKAALEKIVNVKLSAAQPKNVPTQSSESKFIKYKPSQQSAAFNSGAKERIIRMVEMPVDPLEPPKFKHKRVPKASGSPPVPQMHSPPRPVTVKDQQDWKIPPCISNWKNPKGYTIPLDKRLAADGRGLQDVQINDNFAKLSEALYVAEQKAREAVAMRSKVQKELLLKEKDRKEQELRALAQKARSERTGIAAAPVKDEVDDMELELEHREHRKETREEREERLKRDKIREDRRRERERERRLEAKDAAMGKKSKITRDRDRDISEKVALGMASTGAGRGGEVMYDQRLFNQDKGMESGFAADDRKSRKKSREREMENRRGSTSSSSSSFSSLRAYGRALGQTPRRLGRRAGSVTTTFEEMSRVRARSGPDMARSLRWTDLVGLGLGGMIGAGVFVSTGRAARLYAGPAVVVSYAIAGFCALLSAFCYTEFAVDMPVAGGAFSYLRVTFGEFAAFLTGANLVMEYVFSNAAVARSFTAYLGTAIGVETTQRWRFTVSRLPDGFNQIDLLAVAVVLLITLCICYSTKESSALNLALTSIHMVFILFIILVGFWRGDVRNFTVPSDPARNPGGFFPYGVGGVFNGAAMVYLSYIGYDAVSTMAEEVKSPATDIPIGVSGSVALVTVIYCLMAASMSMLVPYDAIDTESPFSAAFKGSNGWGWASNVIGVGAGFGILTSMLVSMLGQARYLCVIARSNVVPACFARIHPNTATPVNASVFLGVFTAAIALFTDLNVLLNLVSIGTLFVFYMVANAVIYRRYVSIGTTDPRPTLIFLLAFSTVSLAFTLLWQFAPPGSSKAASLGACTVAAVGVLCLFQSSVPQAQKPKSWGVPLMPWLPSVSIFLNMFLLGSLDGPSYVRFGFFSALVVLVYVLYSVHASFDAEENEGLVESPSDGLMGLDADDVGAKL